MGRRKRLTMKHMKIMKGKKVSFMIFMVKKVKED